MTPKPLNLTIKLINDTYKSALSDLILEHYTAELILTKLDKSYLGGEITIMNMKELGALLMQVMLNTSNIYMSVPKSGLCEAVLGFKEAGLNVRNILTIPIQNEAPNPKCVWGQVEYDERDLMYVIFATKNCYYNKRLNPGRSATGVLYKANWEWFKGTEEEAWKTMIKLSSNHGDEILDPFMAKGYLGGIVRHADRHYTGIEPFRIIFDTAKEYIDSLGE